MCSILARHPSHHFLPSLSPQEEALQEALYAETTQPGTTTTQISASATPSRKHNKSPLGWGPGSQICALSISPQTWCFFLLGGNGGDESLMWARHVVLKMYKFNVDVKQVMHGLHFTNSGPTAKWGQKFYPFWYFLFFVDGPGAREATNFKNLVLPEMNVCTHMHIYICIYICICICIYIYTCVLHMNIGTRHLGHFGSSFRRLIAQNVPSTLSTCRPRG